MLTKGEMYVGKDYLSEGLFKINCIPKIMINKNIINSSFIVDSCTVWHARLGHVNFKSMLKMVNLGLFA